MSVDSLEKILPVLESERLVIRLGDLNDVPVIVEYYRSNREFLKPWSPTYPPDFFTKDYWAATIRRYIDEYYAGTALRWFVFKQAEPGKIIGAVNYTQINRGPAQFCYLGFTCSQAEQGKGYMYESISCSIQFVFEELNLHRIMANYMPHNQRSGALLKRLGFVPEGYARDYLLIDGQWCDHIMTSLTHHAWQQK